MKTALSFAAFLTLVMGVTACTVTADDRTNAPSGRADRVVLDVRCSVDTDCPSGFECEIENEQGVETSYCKSHGSSDGSSDGGASSSTSCPPGFEQELEHGGVFCKPHGSSGDGTPGNTGTQECAVDEDCAAGMECEIETEHGVTTSYCKPHGGNE